MRLVLIIEYEGTNYSGFQFQENAPSIQEEIENAITRFTGETVRIKGAGRTDAGVHAQGQVVAFDTASSETPETFVRAVNHFLPDDIAAKAAYRAPEGFDPRRQATGRRYAYSIDCGRTRSPLRRRTTYHLGCELDVESMRDAAQELVGVHDFAGFAGSLEHRDASTIREIYSTEIHQNDDLVEIEVYGSAFLPHQVRRMSGALTDVGRGKLTRADIKAILDGSPTEAVANSLPPQGLSLLEVTYNDFPVDNGAE